MTVRLTTDGNTGSTEELFINVIAGTDSGALKQSSVTSMMKYTAILIMKKIIKSGKINLSRVISYFQFFLKSVKVNG